MASCAKTTSNRAPGPLSPPRREAHGAVGEVGVACWEGETLPRCCPGRIRASGREGGEGGGVGRDRVASLLRVAG